MRQCQIECSRTRAITVSAIAIFVTGTLIGLTSALPHYVSAKKQLEQFNAMHIESIASTVDNQMSHYLDIALQTASRSEIRKRLEQYAAGTLSYQEVVDYSRPRLNEAFRQLNGLVAAMRLGSAQERIFSTPAEAAIEPVLGSPLQIVPAPAALKSPSHWLLQASAAIVSDINQQTVGRDILYFSASELSHSLSLQAEFAPRATLYLLDRRNNRLLISDGRYLQPVSAPDNLLQQLAANTASRSSAATAVLFNYTGEQGLEAVFYQPLTTFDGALIMTLPKAVLYFPALKELLSIGALTLLMMLIATLLTRRALKPLIGRIVEQAQALQESNAELQLAASVFENTQEGIVLTDIDLNVLRVNQAFSDILGYDGRAVLGSNLRELFESKYRVQGTLEAIFERLQRENSWQGEIWYQRRNNSTVPALQTISVVRDESDSIVRLIHIFNDISESKASELRIQRLAHFDALTGLANRNTLQQQIAAALEKARLNQSPLALLFLDLDHFKPVNDTLGHPVGDKVLKAVAQRIRHSVRENDLIGRIGGDEFLLVLNGATARDDASIVARKLIEQLAQPFQIDAHSIRIGASIGIALFPDDGDNAETLISQADEAMYRAKRAGGLDYRYYGAPQGTA